MFLSAHKATKKLGISSHTLRRWSKQRKIEFKTSASGTRLYDVSKFFPDDSITTITASKKNYLYARVSSQKQKQDLERQKEILLKKYPTYELIKRKGLQTLLERSCKGLVGEIVVTHRDRLCRFAYDLLKHVFTLHSTKLMVLFDDSTTDEHELSEDILAINTVFICRMQGRRAAEHRRERKKTKDHNGEKRQKKKDERKRESDIECEIVSESRTKTIAETMDGIDEIDL